MTHGGGELLRQQRGEINPGLIALGVVAVGVLAFCAFYFGPDIAKAAAEFGKSDWNILMNGKAAINAIHP
jgi:hypothetical protein